MLSMGARVLIMLGLKTRDIFCRDNNPIEYTCITFFNCHAFGHDQLFRQYWMVLYKHLIGASNLSILYLYNSVQPVFHLIYSIQFNLIYIEICINVLHIRPVAWGFDLRWGGEGWRGCKHFVDYTKFSPDCLFP